MDPNKEGWFRFDLFHSLLPLEVFGYERGRNGNKRMINIYREKIKVKIHTKTLPKPQNQVKNIFQKKKKMPS